MAYRYQEQVSVHAVVKIAYLAMLLVLVVSLANPEKPRDLFVLLPVAAILFAIPLLFGRLVFDVQEEAVRVTFGYVGWPQRVMRLEDIQSTEVVTYRPIRQFGGWGIRGGKFRGEFTGVYSLRGNRGLLLVLAKDARFLFFRTRRILLGSEEPEKLQQAIGC